MPKINTITITDKNLKLLRKNIALLIVKNYVAGDAIVAADKILKLFVLKEKNLKFVKK